MAGLGEILEQARLDRGVSFDEAERATHISRRYLEALEAEDFSVFAAPVFMRGFLRTYSQYLGLDPADTLALLPDAPEAPPPEPEPEPETARGEFERRTQPLRDRQPPRRPVFRTGAAAPGPLTRVRVPATAQPTPLIRVAGVLAGGLIAVLVLGFAFSKAGGHGIARSTRGASTAAPAAAPGTQFKPTPPPPARKAGTMPNFAGKDGQAAIQQLQQVGVTPLVISVASSNRNDRPGAVLRQDPSPGTALTTNSNVTLVVNQAPTATATTTVPGALPPLATPTRGATSTRGPTPTR